MADPIKTRPDFVDELEEGVRDVMATAKKQITAKVPAPSQPSDQVQAPKPEENKKVDPVTGKPIPSKKALTQLNQQVAQLAQMRLKKVREELEKQRLKTEKPTETKAPAGQAGPEVKPEEPKPKEDAVAKTLKASKSTGEFKGLIGG